MYSNRRQDMVDMTWQGDNYRGPELIGRTGARGYRVPPEVQQSSVRMFGNWIRRDTNYPRTEVLVHRSYKVPRNIEDLVCIETGRNAVSPIPRNARESPQRNQEPRPGGVDHSTYQFQVVAWESAFDVDSDDEDSCDDQDVYGLWRMGYVMNDLGKTLRVMVPSGRMYYVNGCRAVFFDGPGTGWAEEDVDDEKVLNSCEEPDLAKYRYESWYFNEDEEDMYGSTRLLSWQFVKDQAYPMDRSQRR